MPFIIIDEDDNILDIVSTIEEANTMLKQHMGSRCEQLVPMEKLKEDNGDTPIQEKSE